MIIDTCQQYEPEDIRNIVAAIEPDDMSELFRAVMVLCDEVKRQGWRIAELEDAEEKRHAADGLAESVELYKLARPA